MNLLDEFGQRSWPLRLRVILQRPLSVKASTQCQDDAPARG